jgi:hypothetical protein
LNEKYWDSDKPSSLFFRAKAHSRNSFISTNPYKFAVKNKGSQIGYGQQNEGSRMPSERVHGKVWKKKKNETEKNTLCKRYRVPGIRSTFRYFIIG